jgi:1-acyl-sn-glycerol-3-phosphate acyltransferase
MLVHWPDNQASSPTAPPEERPALRAAGLVTVRISSRANPLATWTMVADLDSTTIDQVRGQALAMRARQPPIVIELRYVADPAAGAAIRRIEELAADDVQVIAIQHGERGRSAALVGKANGKAAHAIQPPIRPTIPAPARSARRAAAPAPQSKPATAPDPFGLDRAYRATWLPMLRFLFERYWRIEVSGLEHVPSRGQALIASNHSGALPVDAFMLAAALELQHPEHRVLRVLYDKFVDALPFIGPIYSRLGAVRASFANAEDLLRRGELVGLFPEGIAGVEKRFTERYRLQPFKSGTARLSVRTGSPIVPVAIVGAEEAYPVMARLYRVGNLIGVPWIPVTPLFPLFGLAGALPLPSHWHIRFCEPIMPPAEVHSEEDAVTELTRKLRLAIAVTLADMLARRHSVFF